MKKPNIAFFTSAQSGLSHYVTHLYGPIKKYFNPYYITYSDAVVDEFVKENIGDVHQLIQNGSASSILMTLQFLKDHHIEYIDFNIATTARKNYLHYVALLAKARVMGIKVISTIHDVMPFESFYIDPAVLELLYSGADHYIVGNDAEAGKLQLYFQVPKNKITVSQHGPYTMFDNHKFTKDTAREHLGIPQNKKVILFFGMLRPHKGLKYLVKAFQKIIKQVPDAWLYISSDLKYNPELKDLLRRVEKSGVADKIQIVKKYVPSSELEPIFKAADIVAMPYTIVSQSGVLNLAYAFKKPVVVTDIFPDASAIDRKIGRVVPTEDAVSLEQSLIDLLNESKSTLEKMGKAGYDYSMEHASWEKAAEDIYNISKKIN